jgi:hypothetical protein
LDGCSEGGSRRRRITLGPYALRLYADTPDQMFAAQVFMRAVDSNPEIRRILEDSKQQNPECPDEFRRQKTTFACYLATPKSAASRRLRDKFAASLA